MLWLINIAICWLGFRAAFRTRSLLIIFWLYGLYVGSLGFVKFSLGALPVKSNHTTPQLEHVFFYVVSNGLFLVTCVLFWHLNSARTRAKPNNSIQYGWPLVLGYACAYSAGVYIYVKEAIHLNYESFVNYDESAWGQVLFYTGASLIAIAAAKRRPVLALLLTSPYLALSVLLGIRSFVALSLFPVIVILAFRGNHSIRSGAIIPTPSTVNPKLGAEVRPMRNRRRHSQLTLFLVLAVLAIVLFGASQSKLGKIALPEESLIEYYFIVADTVEKNGQYTGSESAERFFWGLASPALKQIGVRYERNYDPQAIFATYIDDYAGRLDQYFHYPSLWQADTFHAFGYSGLLLAPFWALVLLILERAISRSQLTWTLFLPVSCWAVFMFARGAVGNATISVSYVIFLQILVALIGWMLWHPRAPFPTRHHLAALKLR